MGLIFTIIIGLVGLVFTILTVREDVMKRAGK